MKSIIIFVLILFSFNSFATRGKLNLEEGSFRELQMGEIFEGVLRLWPVEPKHYNNLLKLENTFILDSFFLAKIERIKLSENNSEVIELYGSFVIHSPIDPNKEKKLKLEDESISISIEGFGSEQKPLEVKGFGLLEQNLKILKDRTLWWVVGTLLLVIILLTSLSYYFKNKEKLRKQKLEKEARENWIREISTAQDLDQYEKIYQKRQQWQSMFSYNKEYFIEFRKRLNDVQFKKNKGDEDLQFVRDSFIKLAQDISENNGN